MGGFLAPERPGAGRKIRAGIMTHFSGKDRQQTRRRKPAPRTRPRPQLRRRTRLSILNRPFKSLAGRQGAARRPGGGSGAFPIKFGVGRAEGRSARKGSARARLAAGHGRSAAAPPHGVERCAHAARGRAVVGNGRRRAGRPPAWRMLGRAARAEFWGKSSFFGKRPPIARR